MLCPYYFRFGEPKYLRTTNHQKMNHLNGWIMKTKYNIVKDFFLQTIWIPRYFYLVYPYFILMSVTFIVWFHSPASGWFFLLGMFAGAVLPVYVSGYAIINRAAYKDHDKATY